MIWWDIEKDREKKWLLSLVLLAKLLNLIDNGYYFNDTF